MASVQSQLRLNDGMSAVLRRVTAALDICLASFEQVQAVSGQAMDVETITAARAGLSESNAVIDEMATNLQRVASQQNSINQTAQTGTSAYGGMLRKIGQMSAAYVSMQGLQKAINLSDQISSSQARLSLVVDDGGSVSELESKIFASAQRSRGSYLSVMDTVSKLGLTAGDAFSGNDEMIRFAELMNQNFIIPGASATEQSSAMYQLTQAMAAGKLQGDEYRVIIENAPLLANSIEDYMRNVQSAKGSMKDWAADGLLTADVIKAALFSSADEIEQRFAQIPMTWGQLWTVTSNNILRAVQPLLEGLGAGAQWVSDNWDIVTPVLYGVAAACGAVALAMGIQTAATWIATGAAKKFFVTLLTNPLTWIALIIGVLVALIYKWVQAVGGLDIAWKIVVHGMLVAWDWVKIGFVTGVNSVLAEWSMLALGLRTAGVEIANFMGDMKVNVLIILQNMVNGAINIINEFIGVLNTIPGVNIGLIEQVTFSSTAQLQNEAEKQARMKALDGYRNSVVDGIAQREAALQAMKDTAASQAAERWQEIQNLQAEKAKAAEEDDGNGLIKDIANNTGSTADSLKSTNEKLEYMRDIAEREAINRYTTASIKVDMTGMTNRIDSGMDIDGLFNRFSDGLREAVIASAEGVHA